MIFRLPGLMDPHVHLREPGGTHKEDIRSGTAAALAGGFTTVLAMPNTTPPLVDVSSLQAVQQTARARALCDVSFFLGATVSNLGETAGLAARVCGLKVYADQTYGPLHLPVSAQEEHAAAWPAGKPLAVHAEGGTMAAWIDLAERLRRHVHLCHVSRAHEIRMIRAAKERGVPVTCEVTPHHLFLTAGNDPCSGEGRTSVRPSLASGEDVDALWRNLDVIDCFATDHAPHTLAEKDSASPPPGFPGLETALGLLLTAVSQGRLSLDDVVERMCFAPRRIFQTPPQEQTWIDVDLESVWEVRGANLHTRCKWSPFEGMRLKGIVRRVVLHDRTAFADGEVTAPRGSLDNRTGSISTQEEQQ